MGSARRQVIEANYLGAILPDRQRRAPEALKGNSSLISTQASEHLNLAYGVKYNVILILNLRESNIFKNNSFQVILKTEIA